MTEREEELARELNRLEEKCESIKRQMAREAENKEGANRKGVEAAAKAGQLASWYIWKAYGILRPHTEFMDFNFTCGLNDKAVESMKTWPEFSDKNPDRISWDYASPKQELADPNPTLTNPETTRIDKPVIKEN